MVYSPTVSLLLKIVPVFTTNRSEPDTAMPKGVVNPEMSDAFTVAAEVVYSPTPLLPPPAPSFTTKRSEPDTAIPVGLFKPEISVAFTVAPEVVYSPIMPRKLFTTNIRL